MAYAELHCLSNFTFLRGASHPEELVARAHELGYTALALTDECSFAGIVRAHVAAKECGLKLIVGSEIRLVEGPHVVLLATDRAGYGKLSAIITHGRRSAAKGNYKLALGDLGDGVPGCLVLLLADPPPALEDARTIAARFAGRAWLAVELFRSPDDTERLAAASELATAVGLPLMAAGDVHMHVAERRPMQDALTAIRIGVPVFDAGNALHPNAERHLRGQSDLAQLYPQPLLDATLAVAARCTFSLDELRYEYPEELVPPGETAIGHLRSLTEAGLQRRFPYGTPDKVRAQVEYELALIEELRYEPYFLTVHDIVRFARSRGILCQGRGSAANSAVCYALGITEVNPACIDMLFERFISRERNEPPDIDVDFEHERREEVIQYLYAKYGRDRAALAATVISYRPRSAMRDVGKALGFDLEQVDRLAKSMAWWDGRKIKLERLVEAGFDPATRKVALLIRLVDELVGFPRHLSQHVGGFVIARGQLSQLVPIENAAMPERTIIQWDKDDLGALGLLKIDVLALGMLSAIRRALDLVSVKRGRPFAMSDIPSEDPAVYDMIGHADTVGVFQIESRAQMAMLPRMKPRRFYDLVIEVAIVRPGPIQGGMVHPYLRRREQVEPVTYPSEEVRGVLERTLGVPIFQEQAMQLAVVAAGFTPGEADRLRRSMAAWRRKGGLEAFERRLIEGMRERGYQEDFARQIFMQIQGFGEYGFPESHAASFALLVYVSAWLKCYEPAAFACALLNSQPMGFYAPSQIVQDARRHGVEVRPVDVLESEWDCTLEAGDGGQSALRLGLRQVKGFSLEGVTYLTVARARIPIASVDDLARCGIDPRDLKCLAAAGALARLSGHRRLAYWEVAGIERATPLVMGRVEESQPELFPLTEGQDLVADYASLGLSLGRHPLALLRGCLQRERIVTATELGCLPHGRLARAAGLVLNRQRPGTASGVTFLTLEDETGHVNVVVWRDLAERQRRELLGARLLAVYGMLERHGEVAHLIAGHLRDLTPLLGNLVTHSRDFH
ncbi:MAG: error-prone DNA polymerase [Thiobacillus sp.]|jgi:error-prone DNA polymerase|uniref:error-prone DNA polymerase n=1 Tax=Thiobacillus sp. TaxID=924 RepID=UPI002893FF28|nr:error-prone DNA polymerase [Thiobacillus sp.]MDT3707838.1 error-prone DNA polymerase [Thiobacillus sp.]